MNKRRIIVLSATAMAIFAGPTAAMSESGGCHTAYDSVAPTVAIVPPQKEVDCTTVLNGNYPNPTNCCGYIACSNGNKYYMPCPSDLHWDWHSDPPTPTNDGNGQCTLAYESGCRLNME